MLVRRCAIEQVGLLDEAYWLYMEDLDWCYRFSPGRMVVWYDGSSSFVHVKGGTSKRRGHRSLRATVAFHRGMGRFRKFYAGPRPLLDGAVYTGIGAKLAISASAAPSHEGGWRGRECYRATVSRITARLRPCARASRRSATAASECLASCLLSVSSCKTVGWLRAARADFRLHQQAAAPLAKKLGVRADRRGNHRCAHAIASISAHPSESPRVGRHITSACW